MSTGATRSEIEHATEILRSGGLVAFPTETVYGLGASADIDHAVHSIFEVKRRPQSHPVIVHTHDVSTAQQYAAEWNAHAVTLAAQFWPGPLTLVVPRNPNRASVAAGGLATIGLRIPDHPVALDLLRSLGSGVAAPSANRFGSVSPTTAEHVWDDLGDDVELILDGGPCRSGVESTIVECIDEPKILRLGGISDGEIAEVLGLDGVAIGGTTSAPGTLAKHYSPRARVLVLEHADHIDRLAEGGDVRVIGMHEDVTMSPHVILAAQTVEEYAHGLYAALRSADDEGAGLILAVLPKGEGLARTVRDRLQRAAAP
ncbi:MAG: L-threonylcarbamoyladenylate synthase [Acidimicrobiia bacterium]